MRCRSPLQQPTWTYSAKRNEYVFEDFGEKKKQKNPKTVALNVVRLLCPQAVDVVGQAGKPKAITGFQTHTTPVLLAHGERAELATEEYLPVTPILEGFVILRKNPNYET